MVGPVEKRVKSHATSLDRAGISVPTFYTQIGVEKWISSLQTVKLGWRRSIDIMTESRKFLLWAPRLILSAFALFIVLFSFDVFGEGKSAVKIAIDFVLHNVPSMVLGLVVFMSWRREWIGALVCAGLGIAYIAWAWGRFPLSTYLFMAGPLFLVSVLYAVNWRLRKHAARSRPGPARA